MPAAIAIPLITAAASGTAAVIGSKLSSNASQNAAKLQSASTDKATALAQEQEAERRREFDQQQSELKRQWDVTEANKAPYRQISSDALLRVRDLLGLPQGAPMGGAGVPSAGAPAASSAMKGSAADLKALIDAGMAPQAAATKFNQQYGRTTGNEAVYYDPSQHGGVATIGLPEAYLSAEKGGWAITPRGGSAPIARPQTAMAAAMPPSVAALAAPLGAGTNSNYAPVIPFSSLMRGVR